MGAILLVDFHGTDVSEMAKLTAAEQNVVNEIAEGTVRESSPVPSYQELS